jgi:hypothetical protein
MAKKNSLTSCQTAALDLLESTSNVFVTGVAGSGKSYLIRQFLRTQLESDYPVLASTGAAAVLVGGRTFHSFFGLGIMQGGVDATVERALQNTRLKKRLQKTIGVIIDEVSMLSGPTLRAAETIARLAREKNYPWGGLRVIAVGDFAQLPPVSYTGQKREWAFQDSTWIKSNFIPAYLSTIVRTKDESFQEILGDIRNGQVTPRVREFLDSRKLEHPDEFLGTRLFSTRDATERYNLERLETLDGAVESIATTYNGDEKAIQDLKRNAPVPEVIRLKRGALVMLRQNDPQGRYVNGSLGEVQEIGAEEIQIDLQSGIMVKVEKMSFSLLNSDGKEVASAQNFPLNLAYATTIHKAQGMTLDSLLVDLRNLWEPGQAYVALSRVKASNGVFVAAWNPSSIKVDPQVQEFYRSFS